MQLNGRDIRFRYSVGADVALQELVPDGDVRKIFRAMSSADSYAKRMQITRQFILILATAHDEYLAAQDPAAPRQNLTMEELKHCKISEFVDLAGEAMNAFLADQKTTVEAAPPKKDAAPERSS